MSAAPDGIIDSRHCALMVWVDKQGVAHARADGCDKDYAAHALRHIADQWKPRHASAAVLDEVDEERGRQDARWDQQNHPDGTGPGFAREAHRRREACELAFSTDHGTWMHVLLEEVYEALTETDPTALARELTQVAAVAVAWIESIDRRGGDA